MRSLEMQFLAVVVSLNFSMAHATNPPTIVSGHTVDFDNYGILLNGANYDASTYVDIRSITGAPILLEVFPPNVTYLPGSVTGTLSFRINDPTVQNLLSTQGLRFYVVSPTAGYQYAGPLTVLRGTPSFTGQPAAFHSIYFHPSQGSLFAQLADDTGSPSPRQQMIWSINNELQAIRASGIDTISVLLQDNDGYPSQHGGGFAYDPTHSPTAQRAVGQEILLRIAAANNLKVIFVIAVSDYRRSTDGRAAWNGLADQYDIYSTSVAGLDFIHSLIDPTPYYGAPMTTKLSTIGLTDGPVRSYYNDPRIAGFILAPEWNVHVLSSTGVATHQYFFNRYWNWFYSLVHYNGSSSAFAGVYVLGGPTSAGGTAQEVADVKKFKTWFGPSTGNSMPDRIGVEFYGNTGYSLQNEASDMNVILDSVINADTVHYPGDFAISAQKVFLGEGNTDEIANAYTNQYYQYMVQLLSKRVLAGVQWWASDTWSDGTPPTLNDAGWNLYNINFTLTGTKVFATSLPPGIFWHNPVSSYADPTTFAAYTDNFSAQWGKIAYSSPTAKGYWYGQAISNFVNGNNSVAYAYPNPMTGNASHLGTTTISWDITERPTVTAVEVHVGSPAGSLLASGAAAGSVATGLNVTNGTVYFVQDVTGNKPRTLANTLAQIYANVQ